MAVRVEKPAIAGGKRIRETFLDFARPRLSEASIEAAVAAIRSGWLTTGPRVAEIESIFAAMQRRHHAIALNSCTAGLFLGLKYFDIGPGDEVITTPMTFAASANVILHLGATPVFCDVNPDDWYNIDPDAAEAAITPQTRGMVLVHYAGRPVDIEAFEGIASRHGLFVVSDCAHTVEAEYDGEPVGKRFDFSAFSFYANKNATCGEGGMICTDSDEADSWLKVMRLHGMDKDAHDRFTSPHVGTYDIQEAGYKFNLTDMAAALLKPQLEALEEHHARRRAIWDSYNEAFADIPGVHTPPPDKTGCKHALHVYSLYINRDEAGFGRDDIAGGLLAENIGIGVHYTPVHFFSVYRDLLGTRPGMFPEAEEFGLNTLSLPLTPYLTNNDVNDVIGAFRRLAAYFAVSRPMDSANGGPNA